ncbi:MAG: hypothetical protein AAB472_03930 [Patescibacteria group bacterium]
MKTSFLQGKPVQQALLAFVLVGAAAFLLLPLIAGMPTRGGYPVASSDHISSWSWQGMYAHTSEKQREVTKELNTLKELLGKGGMDDYDLYVGIATEYELLGDGTHSYQYLSKAITDDPKRGLAYMNMGHLMETLGAFTTARTAYEAAVSAEPNNTVFKASRDAFLLNHPAP